MKRAMRQSTLSCACILCSLILHASMLFTLHRHTIWRSVSQLASSLTAPMTLATKNEILKEVFHSFSHNFSSASTLPEPLPTPLALTPELMPQDPIYSPPEHIFSEQPLPFNTEQLLTSNTPIVQLNLNFSELTELFPPDFKLPPLTPQPMHSPLASPRPLSEHYVQLSTLIEIAAMPPPQRTSITYDLLPIDSTAILTDDQSITKASLSIALPPLPPFPTMEELDTTSYSDSFDLEVVCLPRQDRPGYLFALTLIPHPNLVLPKLHKHYLFLIDRSNAIQRERLIATKEAILRALEDLHSEDSFNIMVFDNKVEKLFSTSKEGDLTAIAQAKIFLDKIQLGSFFAQAELYNPLFLILPFQEEHNEVYHAILFTDGEGLAKKTSARSILQTWTEQNRGKVALFTLGMGGDAQLAQLDIASAFNKGKMYVSPTKRGLKRKLMKLMKHIQNPVAKSLSCKAISKHPYTNIELFPKDTQMPHLYLNQPIVLVGSSDTPDDFILFVQGRLKDRWINLKKTVSFANAKRSGSELRKEWAKAQAYQCYERYLIDDNPEHLVQAQEFLAPFNVQPAFQ